MTSGMSAKGSALGAEAPESGARTDRAPLPRAPGNGTKRSRETKTGTDFQEAGIIETPDASPGSVTAESSHPALSSSVRTLILGIDYDGRIVQHDRNAAQILARKPEDLLGAQLIELTPGGSAGSAGGWRLARRARRALLARRGTPTAPGRATAPPRRWPGCSRPSVRIVRAVPCSRSRPGTATRPRPW